MEEITHLLHTFYESSLDLPEREAVHAQLLGFSTTEKCLNASDDFVSSSTALLTSLDSMNCPDWLTLYYALHALEYRVRLAFETTGVEARKILQTHLIDLLVSCFSWNSRVASVDSASMQAVPPYIIAKAARACVELGKREWVTNGSAEFPRVVLGLVDESGHTTKSVCRIFAGMAILTTLVDDALDSSRTDMLAMHRAVLKERIISVADGIVGALEMGLRIRGPGLPQSVPASAARTVGSIVRVAPSCALTAIRVMECRASGAADIVSIDTLSVLADVLGESKLPVRINWPSTFMHIESILARIAAGETVHSGTLESVSISAYHKALVRYVEATVCRTASQSIDSPQWKGVLNVLMGCTMQWASKDPEAFVAALGAWISFLETIEDAELVLHELSVTVSGAIFRFCFEKCMFSSNGNLLRSLEETESGLTYSDDQWKGGKFHDEDADVLAEVGSRPISLGSLLFVKGGLCEGGTTVYGNNAEETTPGADIGEVDRASYIGKCVEVICTLARMYPDVIAMQAAEKVSQVLRNSRLANKSTLAESSHDVLTALSMSKALGGVLAGSSRASQDLLVALSEILTDQLFKYPEAGVALFQTCSAMASTLASKTWSQADHILNRLSHCSSSLIQAYVANGVLPRALPAAAAVFLLSIQDISLRDRRSSHPVLPPELASSIGDPLIPGLAVIGMARWALVIDVHMRTATGEELAMRATSFESCCSTAFRNFEHICSQFLSTASVSLLSQVTHGSVLVRCLFWCVYRESSWCKETVWNVVGRSLLSRLLEVLRTSSTLVERASSLDGDVQNALFSSIGTIIGCMGCAMRVFRKQIQSEVPSLVRDVLDIGFGAAGKSQSMRLARALLGTLREQLSDGFSKEKEHLVLPAISLASRSLNGDGEIAETSVGVLGEAIIRHWLLFWPGDLATTRLEFQAAGSSLDRESMAVVSANAESSTSQASIQVQQAYMTALNCVLEAANSDQPGMCRVGLLMLEKLNAGCKLYSRKAGFRDVSGAEKAISACLRALDGTRGGVAEEALSVLWGIASEDWKIFYNQGLLRHVLGRISACTEDECNGLMTSLGTPTDRPTFSRGITWLVNDMAYLGSLRKQMSL